MEIWKDIVGHENKYQVSNLGNVRSLDHEVQFGRNKRIVKGKLLNFNLHKSGYVYIHVGKKRTVHRMVAEAFVPNPLNKPFVNHINGNKSDNRAENLEWVNANENCIHGLIVTQRIRKRRHNKLTDEQAAEIANSSCTYTVLSHKFNVSFSTIYLLKKSMRN